MFNPRRFETKVFYRVDHTTSTEQRLFSSEKPKFTTIGPDNYQAFMTIEAGETSLTLPLSAIERVVTRDHTRPDEEYTF